MRRSATSGNRKNTITRHHLEHELKQFGIGRPVFLSNFPFGEFYHRTKECSPNPIAVD